MVAVCERMVCLEFAFFVLYLSVLNLFMSIEQDFWTGLLPNATDGVQNTKWMAHSVDNYWIGTQVTWRGTRGFLFVAQGGFLIFCNSEVWSCPASTLAELGGDLAAFLPVKVFPFLPFTDIMNIIMLFSSFLFSRTPKVSSSRKEGTTFVTEKLLYVTSINVIQESVTIP